MSKQIAYNRYYIALFSSNYKHFVQHLLNSTVLSSWSLPQKVEMSRFQGRGRSSSRGGNHRLRNSGSNASWSSQKSKSSAPNKRFRCQKWRCYWTMIPPQKSKTLRDNDFRFGSPLLFCTNRPWNDDICVLAILCTVCSLWERARRGICSFLKVMSFKKFSSKVGKKGSFA